MTRTLATVVLGLVLATAGKPVFAQSCSATATPINFGSVSPIRMSVVDATGSITVTCTWPLVTLTPNAHVCLNLGSGSGSPTLIPRLLSNSGHTMRFNLYRDAARTQVWGSSFSTAALPISLQLSKPLLDVSRTVTVPYYGRIEANQPGVPVIGNGSTIYTENFDGTHSALTAHYYSLVDKDCASMLNIMNRFPFTAQAQVINDCTISATNMAFPSTGILDHALQATSTLNVRCTNGNAWRIALSGGSSGNMLDRRMKRTGGGGDVRYQLYTNTARNIIWGDGTAGTGRSAATGNGLQQTVTVYGTVPAQTTPSPGTYRDTIIATITF